MLVAQLWRQRMRRRERVPRCWIPIRQQRDVSHRDETLHELVHHHWDWLHHFAALAYRLRLRDTVKSAMICCAAPRCHGGTALPAALLGLNRRYTLRDVLIRTIYAEYWYARHYQHYISSYIFPSYWRNVIIYHWLCPLHISYSDKAIRYYKIRSRCLVRHISSSVFQN